MAVLPDRLETMHILRAACLRLAAWSFGIVAAALVSACSPVGLAMTAAGIATDTSVTWDVVKHVHGKLTENDPAPCMTLNGVERALNPRCEYSPGRIRAADLARSGFQECALTTATRDARLWRALPELLDRGASLDRCAGSPLSALAATDACPDFAAAGAPERAALAKLAESDPRAVRHDVFRMLSCPAARAAGLDRVLDTWLVRGDLAPAQLSFSPLGALHPDLIGTPVSDRLERAGHRAETALDAYDGVLAGGFEEALRASNWVALDWWIARVPRLVNGVPPSRGAQLAWLPLQRVLVRGFLLYPQGQGDMVDYLMAHGAAPKARLPFNRDQTVIIWARQTKSPMLTRLDPPAVLPDVDRLPVRQAATPLAADARPPASR